MIVALVLAGLQGLLMEDLPFSQGYPPLRLPMMVWGMVNKVTQVQLLSPFHPSLPNISVLRRIPKDFHEKTSTKITTILDQVVGRNGRSAWERLLLFPICCLWPPQEGKAQAEPCISG